MVWLDTLAEHYGVSTGMIPTRLQDSSYQVVERALSNYAQTDLSLALNMSYLDTPAYLIGSTADRGPLFKLIDFNRVARSLRQIGHMHVLLGGVYAMSVDRQQAGESHCDDTTAELNCFGALDCCPHPRRARASDDTWGDRD
jgi:hypothetical protein